MIIPAFFPTEFLFSYFLWEKYQGKGTFLAGRYGAAIEPR